MRISKCANRIKKVIASICIMSMVFPMLPSTIVKAENQEHVINVDPINGNDSGNGPFKTISAAKEYARNLEGNVTIDLSEGVYRLTEPLEFTNEDSGKSGTITYRGNGQVEITGNREITGEWEPVKDKEGIYRISAFDPQDEEDTFYSRELYVDGKKAKRAQHNVTGQSSKTENGFSIPTDEIFVNMESWENQGDIEIRQNKSWTQQIGPVEKIENNEIFMKKGFWDATNLAILGTYAAMDYPAVIENAYELLDEPGEWYLNRTDGYLYYMPTEGQNLDEMDFEMPVLGSLISASGTKEDLLENIVFDNITFTGTTNQQITDGNGWKERQAGVRAIIDEDEKEGFRDERSEGALEFDWAKNITIRNCTLKNLGTGGISFDLGCCDNVIEGNRIENIGVHGISIGDINWGEYGYNEDGECDLNPEDDRYLVKNNQIKNNYISKTGLDVAGAVAIRVGFTNGTVISHNTLEDLGYTAISVGWGWGYSDEVCGAEKVGNNKIEYNKITDYMKVLNDGGGIYTLGEQADSEIKYNYIENQANNFAYLYLDNGTEHFTVEHNVINQGNSPNNKWYMSTDYAPIEYNLSHDNESRYNYYTKGMVVHSNASDSVCAGNIEIEKDMELWPEEAKSIYENAGANGEDIKLDPIETEADADALVRNGSFEMGKVFWKPLEDSTLRIKNGAMDGSYCIQVEQAGSKNGIGQDITEKAQNFESGLYRIEAWIRSSEDGEGVITMQSQDDSFEVKADVRKDQWQKVTGTTFLKDPEALKEVAVSVNGLESGSNFQVDGVLISYEGKYSLTTDKSRYYTGEKGTLNIELDAEGFAQAEEAKIYCGETLLGKTGLTEDANAGVKSGSFSFDTANEAFTEGTNTLIVEIPECSFKESVQIIIKNSGDNILQNGDFEDGMDPWKVINGGSLEVSSDAQAGRASLKLSGRQDATYGIQQDITEAVSEYGAGIYSFTGYVKAENAERLSGQFITEDTNGRYKWCAVYYTSPGEWQKIEGRLALSDAAAKGTVAFAVNGQVPQDLLLDEFELDYKGTVEAASDQSEYTYGDMMTVNTAALTTVPGDEAVLYAGDNEIGRITLEEDYDENNEIKKGNCTIEISENLFSEGNNSIIVKIGDVEKEIGVNIVKDGAVRHQILSCAEEHGQITPKGLKQVRPGENVTYTIEPNEGYEIQNVLVDGVDQGAISSYTFEDVNGSHVISASFKKAVTREYEKLDIAGAVSSSIWDENYTADKAIDGDWENTRWAAKDEPSSWLQVDLGEEKNVDKIRLKMHPHLNNNFKYVIQCSNDAGDEKNWTDVIVQDTYTESADMTYELEDSVSARYFRVTFLDHAGNGCSIYEIELSTLKESEETEKPIRTVTFLTNGGSLIESQFVEEGDAAKVPEEPAKSGFFFTGWSVDQNSMEEWNFDDPVVSDLILYAMWEQNVELESISLQGPEKTKYFVGEELDLTGLTVFANYSDGSREVVTDYTISSYNPEQIGEQTITVTYKGKTAEFKVQVSKKEETTPPGGDEGDNGSQGSGTDNDNQANTGNKDSSNHKGDDQNTVSKAVKTGDDTCLLPYVFLVLFSLGMVILSGVVLYKKRHK